MKPGGCRGPTNCSLGEHDPAFRGKGAATDPKGGGKGGKEGAQSPGTVVDPSGKGGKSKGGGKGDKGDKGGKGGKGGKGDGTTRSTSPGPRLPRNATTDADGRLPCFKCMQDHENGTSTCPKRPGKFFHGPRFSKAMWDKFNEVSAQQAEAGPAAALPAQEAVEQPAAKAEAKAQAKPK